MLAVNYKCNRSAGNIRVPLDIKLEITAITLICWEYWVMDANYQFTIPHRKKTHYFLKSVLITKGTLQVTVNTFVRSIISYDKTSHLCERWGRGIKVTNKTFLICTLIATIRIVTQVCYAPCQLSSLVAKERRFWMGWTTI